jgi:hypothetical protein
MKFGTFAALCGSVVVLAILWQSLIHYNIHHTDSDRYDFVQAMQKREIVAPFRPFGTDVSNSTFILPMY